MPKFKQNPRKIMGKVLRPYRVTYHLCEKHAKQMAKILKVFGLELVETLPTQDIFECHMCKRGYGLQQQCPICHGTLPHYEPVLINGILFMVCRICKDGIEGMREKSEAKQGNGKTPYED